MFDALVQAALNLTQPTTLMVVLAGSIIGIVIGVTPVIGGIVGVTLFLPFIFAMEPIVALPFIASVFAVAYTGGAITSILVNIPGTAPNAVTCIDGYPMTKNGEPGRAIGAALVSSAMGGVVAVPMALVMTPLIVPMIMALWSPELFFLIALGLSFLAILSRGGMTKGLISGVLGILLSFIGFQASTGIPRFTFGTLQLYDGIDFIPLALGLFGLAEIIDLATKKRTIAQAGRVMGSKRDIFEGAKDVFRNIWLWLRCSVIGFVIGLIPGVGGGLATFIAYGHAKQSSKRPEEFGTGRVEGVIAPESANNAKESGALLTTLAFGIPGSAEMTVMLGAFLMVGIVPGPGMLLDHMPLSFTLLLCIIVANIIAVVICFFTAPYITKLVTVNPRYLFCIIIGIIFVGAFTRGETMFSILLVVIFGGLGLVMERFGFSRPALLLGFVLGTLFEHYFFLSIKFEGALFFVRPISLVLITITAGVLSLDYIRSLFKRRSKELEKS